MRHALREPSSSGTSAISRNLDSDSSSTSYHKKEASTSRFKSLLQLKQNHVSFHAPSRRESVFFDECNREIISLTSGFEQANKTRIVFQRTDQVDRIEFVLPIGKRILSIKLNPTRSVLAYHVERSTIEFINVRNQPGPDGQTRYLLDNKRYVQTSKAKNSKLVGFLWTGINDLVVITDLSVEFYHLDSAKHRLNHVKMFQSATNWFVYQPGFSINRSSTQEGASSEGWSTLMVSVGSQGNSMQPYIFGNRRISRLQRFEVEGNWPASEKMELFERSITIADIYGQTRLLVLQHESLNVRSKGAQIVLYTVNPQTGSTCKTHTLDLDVSGRFAINILDNLIVAHDQPSKSSFVFDIMLETTEKSDCPNHYVSIIDSAPIKQLELDSGKPVEMYSLNWVFFQPNFIVDAKLGLLTTVQLDLNSLDAVFKDTNLMLNFLARRKNLGDVIVRKCREIVHAAQKQATGGSCNQSMPLVDISSTFEHLGKLVISAPEMPDSMRNSSRANRSRHGPRAKEDEDEVERHPKHDVVESELDVEATIYQEDIQREIFRDLNQSYTGEPGTTQNHFIWSTLLEFVFAVRRHKKNVDFCIYEQLLRYLMQSGHHFQLVQLIRAEILKDSKQLACSLLSLKSEFQPAAQMGLDMFCRLNGGELPASLSLDCWTREE